MTTINATTENETVDQAHPHLSDQAPRTTLQGADAEPPAASPSPNARADMSRISILANTKSGKADKELRLAEVIEGFKSRGIDADLRRLKKGEDFAEIARQEVKAGATMIVAAGGDGTMCGVAQALLDSDTPMGVLPMGTFNYFARSLGIPEDVEGALDVIAQGHRRHTNVATLNDRLFLNNANLGIYPEILRTRENTYARWGRSRIAAYWSVVQTMMRLPKPLQLEITADGQRETLKTPLIFVVSNAFQLQEMGLEGADNIAKGELAVLIAQNAGRLGLLKHGVALLSGRAQRNRDFRFICGKSIVIQSKKKSLLVARDGEREKLASPFKIEMLAGGLQVIAPAEAAEETR